MDNVKTTQLCRGLSLFFFEFSTYHNLYHLTENTVLYKPHV